MTRNRKVVLYGGSLFLAGVEASLRERLGLEVTRVDPSLPTVTEMLRALQPDVILFALDAPDFPGVLSLSADCPGSPLIGLDMEGKGVILFWRRAYAISRTEDLNQILQEAYALKDRAGADAAEGSSA